MVFLDVHSFWKVKVNVKKDQIMSQIVELGGFPDFVATSAILKLQLQKLVRRKVQHYEEMGLRKDHVQLRYEIDIDVTWGGE